MVKEKRIQAFHELGKFLASDDATIQALLASVSVKNAWYTPQFVKQQFEALASSLQVEKLTAWLKDYPEGESDKKVGLVLAGNLPLVGFHDILCVLITGFKAQIKTSSDDAGLTAFVLHKLMEIEPDFSKQIDLVDKLSDYDLVIATGSNNSARYFEHYFGKKPHIIRKNRNSVAVISGQESQDELTQLGHDIFDYFGLGCRSVSKVYIPADYDIHPFFEALESFSWIKDHLKYNNNYDFNKSIYLINKNAHFDNGFLLLKEDASLASPLAVVHFERYTDLIAVEQQLDAQEAEIQCVTSQLPLAIQVPLFPFGASQAPALDDYADRVNTLDFLRNNQ